MKLRKIGSFEQTIDLPRAQLVPDLRGGRIDTTALVAALTAVSGGRTRVKNVVSAHSRRGGSLCRMLLDDGGVDDRSLAFALARLLHIPLADLRTARPTPEASVWVESREAHRLGLLPLRYDGRVLTVAVADPTDTDLLERLESFAVVQVNLTIAPEREIRAAINLAYPPGTAAHPLPAAAAIANGAPPIVVAGGAPPIVVASVAPPVVVANGAPPAGVRPPAPRDLDDDAAIAEAIDRIVTQALLDRASDVHIEPLDVRTRVRFRVDGVLREVFELPVKMGQALERRIKRILDENNPHGRWSGVGRFPMTVGGVMVDVRASTTSTIWGDKFVLRLLDRSRSPMRLADLGLSAEAAATYSDFVRSPSGLVVVTGPAGSGKSTTLYATVAEINRPELNVMMVEDQVEFALPSINQIEIDGQADVTFASGLRSVLRQVPDVIVISEVCDTDTAHLAMQSALAGRLVLSSVPAVDAAAAFHRLFDLGVEPSLVASSISCVVAQRLVRRICTSCGAPYVPTADDMLVYERLGGTAKTMFRMGVGCSMCSGTGYRGRAGVYEVLPMTDELRVLLMGRAPVGEIRGLAVAQGRRTLGCEAVRLVSEDVTTIDEVRRNMALAAGGR